ncbi:MAG: TIGR04552 family protein [Proteobacteria bacterium]|nr:TIGR04552 family protein [Pseudomonadota bacterium]
MGRTLHASLIEALGGDIGLSDLEAVRLLLRGSSVIDWNRANFRSYEEVDRFFSLHQFFLEDSDDLQRIYGLHRSAVTYLEEHLGLRFPKELRHPEDVRELFLLASIKQGFSRFQILACVILKLMHVLHHLDAAELRFQIPLSEAALLDETAKHIEKAAARMKESGLAINSFYGNRKSRNSIITKLLAKRENIAATVFDKLRFRIITERKEDILPSLVWLSRELFPFNYVIPNQSSNTLMSFQQMIETDDFLGLRSVLTSNGVYVKEELTEEQKNSFSGKSYKIINFIVDLPIRIDHLVDLEDNSLGKVVFVMVEFQVLDLETAQHNEEGENAHIFYKSRQLKQVKARLRMGGRRWRESQQ